MYNSLNWENYNGETRALLSGEPSDSAICHIAIGTDSLSVGVDMYAQADTILISEIEDVDELFGLEDFYLESR